MDKNKITYVKKKRPSIVAKLKYRFMRRHEQKEICDACVYNLGCMDRAKIGKAKRIIGCANYYKKVCENCRYGKPSVVDPKQPLKKVFEHCTMFNRAMYGKAVCQKWSRRI